LNARADAMRGTLDFQIQSIKATLGDAMEQVGVSIFENLNGPMGKGVTLADKFQKYMKSPEGKQTVRHIADALGDAAKFLGEMIARIPQMITNFRVMAHQADVMTRPLREMLIFAGGGSLKDVATFKAERNVSDKLFGAEMAKDAILASRAATKEGGSHAQTPGIQLHIGQIATGVGMNPQEIITHLMPELQRQLIDELSKHSAGGASPSSAP
jgi:hypothetical protein